MSLPPVFLADPRPARVPRTAEADEAPLIITTLGATAELVANLLKALDGSDRSGAAACNMAATWVRLSLRAYAPAQQDEFWGELTQAVFGQYGSSMESVIRMERPSMTARDNPNELLNQAMFYNACRTRARFASMPKPFPLAHVGAETFRVGAYVLAILGNASTAAGDAHRWVDTIAARLANARTPSPLLRDGAFALAFMERALEIGRLRPMQLDSGWLLRKGRTLFPVPFDDPADTAFKLFLYRNSVPDDLTELSYETSDLAKIRNHLTPWGEVLMVDATFVANMLKSLRADVFLYVPLGGGVWGHASVLRAVNAMTADVIQIRMSTFDMLGRWRAGMRDFAQQAYMRFHRHDDSYWWVHILSFLEKFEPYLVPYAMEFATLEPEDEIAVWSKLVQSYMFQHDDRRDPDLDKTMSNFLLAVAKYVHGVYDPTDEELEEEVIEVDDGPLAVASNLDFWVNVMSLRSGRFAAAALLALRSARPDSVGHEQSALAAFVEAHPSLLDHADGSLFRLDNTDKLVSLVGSFDFLARWADASTTGMPIYFIDYPEVVRAFCGALAATESIRLFGTGSSLVWSNLILPLPEGVEARWVQALALAKRRLHSLGQRQDEVALDEGSLYA